MKLLHLMAFASLAMICMAPSDDTGAAAAEPVNTADDASTDAQTVGTDAAGSLNIENAESVNINSEPAETTGSDDDDDSAADDGDDDDDGEDD